MGHSTLDVSKASLPVTVVVAIVFIFMGWWVNAQDSKISENAKTIDAVEKEQMVEKLAVRKEISAIRTQQMLNSLLLKQAAADLKAMRGER